MADPPGTREQTYLRRRLHGVKRFRGIRYFLGGGESQRPARFFRFGTQGDGIGERGGYSFDDSAKGLGGVGEVYQRIRGR